jgi:hypothetical protein
MGTRMEQVMANPNLRCVTHLVSGKISKVEDKDLW